MHPIEQEMQRLLAEAFPKASIHTRDDSHKHAGHAGARPEGGTHYHVHILCHSFAGKSRVQMQREVNQALAPLFAQGLHALSMECHAP
jgi:BolA protein